jgi:hypothetical protein
MSRTCSRPAYQRAGPARTTSRVGYAREVSWEFLVRRTRPTAEEGSEPNRPTDHPPPRRTPLAVRLSHRPVRRVVTVGAQAASSSERSANRVVPVRRVPTASDGFVRSGQSPRAHHLIALIGDRVTPEAASTRRCAGRSTPQVLHRGRPHRAAPSCAPRSVRRRGAAPPSTASRNSYDNIPVHSVIGPYETACARCDRADCRGRSAASGSQRRASELRLRPAG